MPRFDAVMSTMLTVLGGTAVTMGPVYLVVEGTPDAFQTAFLALLAAWTVLVTVWVLKIIWRG